MMPLEPAAHPKKHVLTILALLAVLLAGLLYWLNRKPEETAKPEPVVQVTVAEVRQENIPLYLSGVGTVLSPHNVLIRPQVDGELIAVHFNEGQMVNQGDLLAEIDPRTIQAALNQAVAEKGRIEAQLKLAQANLARSKTLRQADAVSAQTVDEQQAAVNELQAAIVSAQAAIASSQTQLSYTKIISPVTGRVGIRQIDPGNIVRASDTTPIVTVAQIHPIAAIFSLPQSDLARLQSALQQKNPPVDAFVSDGGKLLASGTLEVVDNQVDPATGTIRLKAFFENENNQLWPGQLIVARLRQAVQQNASVVPVQAVQRGQKGDFVFRIVENKAQTVPVKVTFENSEIAVIDGLKPGEKVVIDGQMRLEDGATVKIATSDKPAAPAAQAQPAQ